MKSINIRVLIIILCLSATVSIYAIRPGDLDPTFGSGGKVYATPAGLFPAQDAAVQVDGKIVIVGSTVGPDSSQDLAIVRLNPNGTPDVTFGTNGFVGIPFDPSSNEVAFSVGIQMDGKIIAAGNTYIGDSSDVAVVRLNTDGSLDESFGGGKLKLNVAGNDYAMDLLIQPDGRIVLAGGAQPASDGDVAVLRLNTDGQFDTTFNGTGKMWIPIANFSDGAISAALQPDGKIVVAGSSSDFNNRGSFLLVRVDASGQLDGGFGTGGIVKTVIGSTSSSAWSVSIKPDGKIIVAGEGHVNGSSRAAFASYNADGTLNTGFDGDGKLIVDLRPSQPSAINSVFVQSDGKIIGVGGAGGSYAAVRLNPTGALDTTFGSAGVAIQSLGLQHSSAYKAVMQPDGKVVGVGEGTDAVGSGYTAARFLTAAPPAVPFDFDADGKTDLGIFRPSVGEWWINRSSNGSTFAATFGASTDSIVPADYTGDGKADIAAWRPSTGEWFVLRSDDFSYFSFPFGTNGDVPLAGDFDGDGKGDATIYRPSSFTWFVRRSSDGGFTIQQFGAAGDVPVASDYDGDGKTDIAIFRPSVGQWWMNRSTAGVLAVTFGNSTDKLVPGDFTGDGKSDNALFRPSTGEWFILRSDDFSFYSFPFGLGSDVPAPGDYDGDGKFDATVFRPTNATWYSQRSTAGTLIQQFGANGDRPAPNAFVP